MSKVEELRHGPRFKKQLAAMNESYEHHLDCERAREAVVKAAMAWWNTSQRVVSTSDDLYPMYAACAALANAEKE